MVNISVIIPIYKVEKYIENCIEGILSQTHKNFELILVNDGSPDKCGEICDQYRQKDNRVKVIHQENQGTGIARNKGLDLATGKYIYFCDPDDSVEVNLLEDNYNLAEKYNANLVVFGYYNEIYTRNSHNSILLNSKSDYLEKDCDFRSEFANLYKKNIMYTLWNKLYKREFLDTNKCRFSNEKVGQDVIFNYRVYKNMSRVVINNSAFYHYVINRVGSATNSYREDRFEIRFNETQKLEELIAYWGHSPELRNIINNDWISTIIVGLSNLLYKDSPLTIKQKVYKAKSIINNEKVKLIINKVPLNNISSRNRKIIMYCLKHNYLIPTLLILMGKILIKK